MGHRFALAFAILATRPLLAQTFPALEPAGKTLANGVASVDAEPSAKAALTERYGKLPLSFEANHGQIDPRVRFLSRGSGYSLFLTGDEAVFSLVSEKQSENNRALRGTVAPSSKPNVHSSVLRMKLVNADSSARIVGEDEMNGISNYLIGNDPEKWRTNIKNHAKVRYEGIYHGIDLLYYGTHRQLEYDFVVAPGANPKHIQFNVDGAKRIKSRKQW
jgi:hypothetical protein